MIYLEEEPGENDEGRLIDEKEVGMRLAQVIFGYDAEDENCRRCYKRIMAARGDEVDSGQITFFKIDVSPLDYLTLEKNHGRRMTIKTLQ